MYYKNLGRSFFCFVTIHAFDRQTDWQTNSFLVARPRCVQCMQRGKNECELSGLQTLMEMVGMDDSSLYADSRSRPKSVSFVGGSTAAWLFCTCQMMTALTVTVTKVFILRFLLKDRKRITESFTYVSYHERSAAMATEPLQPRDLVCGTPFRSSCAIQTSPTDCLDDSWRVTFLAKHEHGALWPGYAAP